MTKQNRKTATVASVLKRGHVNEHGQHPVKIRVIYNRDSRLYPVHHDGKPLYLEPGEWEQLQKDVRSKEARRMKERIQQVEASAVAARDTVTRNRPFTFDRFEKEFLHNESGRGFMTLFESYLSDLLQEQRIGTYKSYKNALEAFRSFRKGKDISPADITPALLKDFESYMLKPRRVPNRQRPLKAGKNTVAMYQRAMKVIYNVAATDNPILKEQYPFATKQNDRGKYKIKTGPGKKADALPVDEIRAFIDTTPEHGTPEWKAKQIWMFSFYCQGMNFRDIALLQYQDVAFDAIRYIRRKTRDTESSEERMEIPLTDAIREIILKVGNPDKRPSAYVFDVLTNRMDAKKQDDAIRQGIKTTNKWLAVLCKDSGLQRITTYTARHSYANLLKQSGESVELIRELLGHSDIRTTESYLKRFDLARKQKVSEKVMAIIADQKKAS